MNGDAARAYADEYAYYSAEISTAKARQSRQDNIRVGAVVGAILGLGSFIAPMFGSNAGAGVPGMMIGVVSGIWLFVDHKSRYQESMRLSHLYQMQATAKKNLDRVIATKTESRSILSNEQDLSQAAVNLIGYFTESDSKEKAP